jgi:hypothetical protein
MNLQIPSEHLPLEKSDLIEVQLPFKPMTQKV